MHRVISFLLCAIVAASAGEMAYSAQSIDVEEREMLQPGTYEPRALTPPPGDLPVPVQVGFHLLSIHSIDDEAETFQLSAVLTLVWNDTRQAFDPAVEGVNEKYFHGAYQFNELSPAWYPQLVFANATEFDNDQGLLLRVEPDGKSTLVQTINAELRSRLDLRKYPFDRQRLEAILEVLGFDESEVELTMAASGAVSAEMSKIQVPEWSVTGVEAMTQTLGASHAGGTGVSSAFIVGIEVHRDAFFMLRLVIVPLTLIVLLSWSVFWMDRSSLGDRMAVSFVGILTAVAYQIMLSDIMPRISYMTLMNAFLNVSFLIMCAAVVVNLRVGALDKRGDEEQGQRLDGRCRWMFPLVYGGLALFALLFFHL